MLSKRHHDKRKCSKRCDQSSEYDRRPTLPTQVVGMACSEGIFCRYSTVAKPLAPLPVTGESHCPFHEATLEWPGLSSTSRPATIWFRVSRASAGKCGFRCNLLKGLFCTQEKHYY